MGSYWSLLSSSSSSSSLSDPAKYEDIAFKSSVTDDFWLVEILEEGVVTDDVSFDFDWFWDLALNIFLLTGNGGLVGSRWVVEIVVCVSIISWFVWWWLLLLFVSCSIDAIVSGSSKGPVSCPKLNALLRLRSDMELLRWLVKLFFDIFGCSVLISSNSIDGGNGIGDVLSMDLLFGSCCCDCCWFVLAIVILLFLADTGCDGSGGCFRSFSKFWANETLFLFCWTAGCVGLFNMITFST